MCQIFKSELRLVELNNFCCLDRNKVTSVQIDSKCVTISVDIKMVIEIDKGKYK